MAQTEKDRIISHSSKCFIGSAASEGNNGCLIKVKDEPDLMVTFDIQTRPGSYEECDALESGTSANSDPQKVSESNKDSTTNQYNNRLLQTIKDKPELNVAFARPDPCKEGDALNLGTSSKFDPHEAKALDGRHAGNSSLYCPLLDNIKQENIEDNSADCSQFDPELHVKVEPCICENIGDCEASTVKETCLPPNFNVKMEEGQDHAHCNCKDIGGGQKQESQRLLQWQPRPRHMTPELRKQHNTRLAKLRKVKMTEKDQKRRREQDKLRRQKRQITMTEEEKEEKREQNRLLKQTQRMTMTEEEKEKRREQNRLLKQTKRMTMTEEEKEKRREQNRLMKQTKRMTLTEEEKEKRREQNRLLQQTKRMLMTEEEKEKRRDSDMLRVQERRMTMTVEEKRRERDRLWKQRKSMTMTEEEREKRREHKRLLAQTKRMTMTEEEKEKRRERIRLYNQRKSMTITEEEKEKRSERMRLYNQRKRMTMTEEEKQKRRDHKWLLAQRRKEMKKEIYTSYETKEKV